VAATTVALVVLAVLCSGPTGASVPAADWPSFGDGPQHTFTGLTELTPSSVATLRPAWRFPTGDAVTATPTVVGDTVYVGSWDRFFYAVSLRTGRLRWRYRLQDQPSVTPYPGEKTRNVGTDGGLVTSSAWYEPGGGRRPALVIFGGGYTLYALAARTGHLYWSHDYTGLPALPADPTGDGARIFSSPVVVGTKVLFGVDVDGQPGERGYIVAADLGTGDPVWEFQTDVNRSGRILNDGCGSVWSSGTVLPDLGLAVFGTADCPTNSKARYSEVVLALDIRTGRLAWVFRPDDETNQCDQDIGATANAGVDPSGTTTFLGEGSKDGDYYALDPATGRLRWEHNVVFGGAAGGFIASTAYDGQVVVGATAVGDYGHFKAGKAVLCDPSDPRDTQFQQPSDHAFSAVDGSVLWDAAGADSFGATTIAGGMAFNCQAFAEVVEVRDVTSGAILAKPPLPNECWSGIATVGDALVLGVGTSARALPAGIVALTPGGRAPIVSRR